MVVITLASSEGSDGCYHIGEKRRFRWLLSHWRVAKVQMVVIILASSEGSDGCYHIGE